MTARACGPSHRRRGGTPGPVGIALAWLLLGTAACGEMPVAPDTVDVLEGAAADLVTMETHPVDPTAVPPLSLPSGPRKPLTVMCEGWRPPRPPPAGEQRWVVHARRAPAAFAEALRAAGVRVESELNIDALLVTATAAQVRALHAGRVLTRSELVEGIPMSEVLIHSVRALEHDVAALLERLGTVTTRPVDFEGPWASRMARVPDHRLPEVRGHPGVTAAFGIEYMCFPPGGYHG